MASPWPPIIRRTVRAGHHARRRRVGEDVTENARTIRSLPLRAKSRLAARFEVRGETVMNRRAFERLNAERDERGLSRFANPRNAAAGSLRVLEPSITASRQLEYYTYFLLVDGAPAYPTPLGIARRPGAHGLQGQHQSQALHAIWTRCWCFVTEWEAKREELPYEIDGVVVKVDSIAPAAAARIYRESAALGHCLQICRAAGGHVGREH